jgi:subfamily B ATP-binding cassette protein MsbA
MNCAARPNGTAFRNKKLWEFARPYFGKLVAATILTGISSPIGLLLPLLTGQVIDAALLAGGFGHLRHVVLLFIGLCVVLALLSFSSSYLLNSAGVHLLRDLRLGLFGHTVRLSQDFHDSLRTGELLSRIGSDLYMIQVFLTGTLPSAIPAVISFFCIIIMLFFIHFKLTLVALLIMPPVALLSVLIGRIVRELSAAQQGALAESSAFAEETINGIRTVRSAGREFFEINRYFAKLEVLLSFQLKSIYRGSTFAALIAAIQLVSTALVLWYGGNLIIRHEMSPGKLVSFMLLAQVFRGLVGGFGGMYANYQSMVGASVRIFEILETQPSIKDPVDAVPACISQGAVAFNNVSFCYPMQKNRSALKRIHIQIQAHEMVGLVGPSGAGKSTLFALLLRFYDPTEGSISIDGMDLKSIRLKDLRKSIGIVPQDIFLFSGTVADNISYFKPEATLEEVQAAAIAAGADEFIERLPGQYNELVGQRGVKLSTGQRQRIAIARAFIINPPILLLDEVTSALDADSEEKVKQALSTLMKGRTTLVIAHRLTTARQANRILVMDDGGIIGSGTHDVLYGSNELYRRYWTLQSLNGKDEAPSNEVNPAPPAFKEPFPQPNPVGGVGLLLPKY